MISPVFNVLKVMRDESVSQERWDHFEFLRQVRSFETVLWRNIFSSVLMESDVRTIVCWKKDRKFDNGGDEGDRRLRGHLGNHTRRNTSSHDHFSIAPSSTHNTRYNSIGEIRVNAITHCFGHQVRHSS